MLKGKHILLGVTGGIAAYKVCGIASKLRQMGAEVKTIMTANAAKLVSPITFEALTANRVCCDTFEREGAFEVEHVSLAKWADVLLIAPATANIIGKTAHGIADDMLSTSYLAAVCPVIFAPAMNTNMYEHPAVKDNIETLKKRGNIIVSADSGFLACGDVGSGRLANEDDIIFALESVFYEKDLTGKTVMVTAGGTKEAIDPVRVITNKSSGKMGYAIAKAALMRGADVLLVSANRDLKVPYGAEVLYCDSASEMYDIVFEHKSRADIIIKCAAVSDYTPKSATDKKIKKKEEFTIELEATKDILKSLGKEKDGYFLVGFAAETDNVIEYAKEKIKIKNLDMIVANDVSDKNIGFGSDDNAVCIITKSGRTVKSDILKKTDIAHKIFDEILKEC